MTHCVFYFPFRFRCQFGHDQICPEEGIEYPATISVWGAQLARYATAWRTRALLAPVPTFSCTLSDECIGWLDEEAQIGPPLASEASTNSGRGRRNTWLCPRFICFNQNFQVFFMNVMTNNFNLYSRVGELCIEIKVIEGCGYGKFSVWSKNSLSCKQIILSKINFY